MSWLEKLDSGRVRAVYRDDDGRRRSRVAFNLTRAAGTLASIFHARATTGTIRAQLITVPARLTKSARRLALHLPAAWPWEHAWQRMLTRANGPPLPT